MTPALGLLVLVGAGLRFATLDGQSLWYDEAVTAQLMRMDLGSMLDAIPSSESSPPLYYALNWLWTQASGTGEVGLRSLSALLGTATIPIVFALARRIGDERTGHVAAALVAVNPMLVWFSQEARAYALLALLGTLTALLWLRALERRDPGRLLAWGGVAALALMTHYYALFLVAPQAVWLALRTDGLRERLSALALPVATCLALAPLALEQRSGDRAAFIGQTPLLERLVQVPKQFLVGYDAPTETLLTVLTAFALLPGFIGLGIIVRDRESREVSALGALAAVALALALLAALIGDDHLITRNVLAILAIVAAIVAAGLTRIGRGVAIGATAVACVLALDAIAGVATEKDYQRDDWRGAAGALGTATAPRLVVVAPASGAVAMRYYLPAARPLRGSAQAATATDVVLMDVEGLPRATANRAPQAPGAQLVRGATYWIVRLPPGSGADPVAIARARGLDAAALELPAAQS